MYISIITNTTQSFSRSKFGKSTTLVLYFNQSICTTIITFKKGRSVVTTYVRAAIIRRCLLCIEKLWGCSIYMGHVTCCFKTLHICSSLPLLSLLHTNTLQLVIINWCIVMCEHLTKHLQAGYKLAMHSLSFCSLSPLDGLQQYTLKYTSANKFSSQFR